MVTFTASDAHICSGKRSNKFLSTNQANQNDHGARHDNDDHELNSLASCPLNELPRAIALVTAKGGQYSAGDATDTLNKDAQVSEAWKPAWMGKTKQCFEILKSFFPGQPITAIAIAGGKACDWERGELYRKAAWLGDCSRLEVKQCGDCDDLEYWLSKQ